MKNFLCLLLLSFLATAVYSQYVPMTSYGYQMQRFKPVKVLHIPNYIGDTTLQSTDTSAQIRLNDGVLQYHLGYWHNIGSGGGAADRFGIEDNLGIQNRHNNMQGFNLTVDSLGTADLIAGDNTFVGAVGEIVVNSGYAQLSTQADNTHFSLVATQAGGANISATNGTTNSTVVVYPDSLFLGSGGGGAQTDISITPTKIRVILNSAEFQYLPLSVAGIYADSTGNIPLELVGTVTSFSSGNLSPLFTTSVATSTSTPALSFTLSNAAANTYYGNNTGSSAAPAFVDFNTSARAALSLTAIGVSGASTYNSATGVFNIPNYSVADKVDTIYRTVGKDSIQFTIAGRYHSILDSTRLGYWSRGILPGYVNTTNVIYTTTEADSVVVGTRADIQAGSKPQGKFNVGGTARISEALTIGKDHTDNITALINAQTSLANVHTYAIYAHNRTVTSGAITGILSRAIAGGTGNATGLVTELYIAGTASVLRGVQSHVSTQGTAFANIGTLYNFSTTQTVGQVSQKVTDWYGYYADNKSLHSTGNYYSFFADSVNASVAEGAIWGFYQRGNLAGTIKNRFEAITNEFPNLPSYSSGGSNSVVWNNTSQRLELGSAGTGGGGATVAGNNTDIQFNNSGAFGGVDSLTYSSANKIVTVYNSALGTSTNATAAQNSLQLINNAPATSGATVQVSPTIALVGQAWNTTVTAATNYGAWTLRNKPSTGGTISGSLEFGFQLGTTVATALATVPRVTFAGDGSIATTGTVTVSSGVLIQAHRWNDNAATAINSANQTNVTIGHGFNENIKVFGSTTTSDVHFFAGVTGGSGIDQGVSFWQGRQANATGIGSVSNSASGTTVTGSNTRFLEFFKVGDIIEIATGGTDESQTISAIASNTSLTTGAWTNAHTTGVYKATALITGLAAMANGQVGIGTATPNVSAQLDMTSTTQGFLPPRMTTTEKNAISSPAEGLMVYDVTLHKLYVYDGSVWQAAW